MSKQGKYWALGITVAIIIIAIWMLSTNNGRNDNGTMNDTGSSMSSNDGGSTGITDSSGHGGMDHNNNENTGNENLTAYIEDQDNIMSEMMDGMMNIVKSGDPSIDYFYGMIPHHKSAIDMAESYLQYGGTNLELKKIAEDIIALQKTEIDQMNTMIKDYEAKNQKDEEKEAAYLEEYNKMFEDTHSHHIDTSNVTNVEQAFAEGMIMHHQMAVDMSLTILEYSDLTPVKEFAQNVIDIQKKEINQMQEILKTLK